ncbi:hypothetical protein [Variovorax sp. MHTC-1]|uniref:hypothetical protein n=1 Tax=Variovorax sp. MHTC-1 TaxID=2495593 RepID=UPI001C8E03E6|nr:hypothetical protein [Variovorax sp. MHTC-1]
MVMVMRRPLPMEQRVFHLLRFTKSAGSATDHEDLPEGGRHEEQKDKPEAHLSSVVCCMTGRVLK